MLFLTQINFYLQEIKENVGFLAIEQGSNDADVYEKEHRYCECESLLDLLNEMGISVQALKIIPITNHGIGYDFNHFDLRDFWSLVDDKENRLFFSIMSYLTRMEFKGNEEVLNIYKCQRYYVQKRSHYSPSDELLTYIDAYTTDILKCENR